MRLLILLTLVFMLVIPVLAYPTYISNTVKYPAGTYGATDIPIWFDDETGTQMFDGEYGGYDWMCNPGGVLSNVDYLARYEQQNGYAYGWVAWYFSNVPVITFDMGSLFNYKQIGCHGYNLPYYGPTVPDCIIVDFSNDRVSFFGAVTKTFTEPVADDTVAWRTIDFQPVQARYARITFESPHSRYWFDEMAINGMDGGNFVIPEPTSLFALGSGLFSLGFVLRRRKH